MNDLLSGALAAVRDAERRLVAGEIPRCEFDAVAGLNVAVIAEAAEQVATLQDAASAVLSRIDYLQDLWGKEAVTDMLANTLRAAIDAAVKGGETNG